MMGPRQLRWHQSNLFPFEDYHLERQQLYQTKLRRQSHYPQRYNRTTLLSHQNSQIICSGDRQQTINPFPRWGDTIHSGQGSTPSQMKFLRAEQKLQRDFKAIHLENQKEKLKPKAQVAALQAQLSQQAVPGSSTAPTGNIDHD